MTCACGCGGEARPGNRFLKGHNNVGRRMSEEVKQRIAAQARERMKGPEREALSRNRRGANNPAWKGGRYSQDGYVRVCVGVDHPMADRQGRVMEHRLVMARYLGRMLKRSEVVHHINEDRSDNRIENLMLFASNGEHSAHHHALRRGGS